MMNILAKILIALVALEHVYILYLEMFLWTKPKGLKSFGLTQEFANQTKALAANQGLYNGFLAAGLIWGLIESVESANTMGFPLQVFFLSCVIIAAIYGSLTAKKSIIYVQGLPAILALFALLISKI